MFDNVGSYPLEISGILLITPLLPTSKHTFGHYEISPSGENMKNQVGIYFPKDLLQKICEIFPKEFTANKFWFFFKQEGT